MRQCLILLGDGQRAVQREDDPAARVRGVDLTGLLDGGNLCHAAQENEQIAAFLGGVALIDPLQDPEVRSGVHFL